MLTSEPELLVIPGVRNLGTVQETSCEGKVGDWQSISRMATRLLSRGVIRWSTDERSELQESDVRVQSIHHREGIEPSGEEVE